MSALQVPEGYAVAPVPTDHLFRVAVPVPGRDPILIEAPKAAWTPLDEQDAVQKWIDPIIAAEIELSEWHEANDSLPVADRAAFPAEAAEITAADDPEKARLITREAKIRFLKPHLSAADYKTLLTSKKIHEKTINYIVDQATSPDITPGESEASTDS